MQLVDNKKVDGEGQPKDEEGEAPLPQLTTQEALSMDVGEEEDPPGPERREENVKTNNHRRKKKDAWIVKPLKVSFAASAVLLAIFHIVRMFLLRVDPRLVRPFWTLFT